MFDPIKTDEGDINDVTLLYNRSTNDAAGTLSHELMHLYGLTDLYGSAASPPLSLMSDVGPQGRASMSLLPYEQWVLGWLPDSSVTCVSQKNELAQNLVENRVLLEYSKGDQSLVIPTGATSALVVDVMTYQQKTYLIYYALENDSRPPIGVFSVTSTLTKSLNITGYAGVSTQLKSPDYTLLVSDNDGASVAVNLIPNGLINSEKSLQLINLAKQKKSENALLAIAKQAAEVKAAADKVAADLKAKEEAEAKAAADKAAADLLAQQKAAAAAKAAALKKTTITCIKGKLTKKVTAVKPVCPAGYKKKA